MLRESREKISIKAAGSAALSSRVKVSWKNTEGMLSRSCNVRGCYPPAINRGGASKIAPDFKKGTEAAMNERREREQFQRPRGKVATGHSRQLRLIAKELLRS